MKYSDLLRDELSLKEAEDLQLKYVNFLKDHEPDLLTEEEEKEITWIAGVDVSYFELNGKEWGVACAILWNFAKNQLEEYKTALSLIRFPYQAGFLGFRECKVLAEAIEKLSRRPEVILCDGHGVIHPRRFGEAVQLGVALDIPSCGVAKNPFVGYSDWQTLSRKKGNKVPIWSERPDPENPQKADLLGYAVSLNDEMKPVFTSPGYRTTPKLAVNLALKTTFSHRQPEPLFLSDKFSRHEVKKWTS